MIAVRWDLNGAELDPSEAQRAVEKAVGFHQRALAGVTCPAHNQAPVLVVRGLSVRTLTVSVETCCDALRAGVDGRIRAVSRRNDEMNR